MTNSPKPQDRASVLTKAQRKFMASLPVLTQGVLFGGSARMAIDLEKRCLIRRVSLRRGFGILPDNFWDATEEGRAALKAKAHTKGDE